MLRGMTWFDGAEPRNDEEVAFSPHCVPRPLAGTSTFFQSTPGALTVLAPLYVDILVPGLPHGNNKNTVLQGGYWARRPAGLVLQAEWGDAHLLEAGGNDDDIRLGGVTLGPRDAASILANWFAAQLRRSVERKEWIGGDGVAIAAEWRLADTGRRLASKGSWLRRRREPTRRIAAWASL